MDIPPFLVYLINFTVKNICFISSFNLSGFNFQPLLNFIHLSLLHSMWKNCACQIEKYVKNMGVNNNVHAQHWTENCGGMSACLHHNPLFSLTTSFWNMSILDWNSACSIIKMNLLEQVWAEYWQLSLNYGGMIRRNSFLHSSAPPSFSPCTTFLDATWMKYSWHLTCKAWQRCNALKAYAFVVFWRWRLITCLFSHFEVCLS